MKKYEKEKNNPNQFIRKDGYDSFVEVLAPTPEFNKVTVQIVKYNKQTNKMVDSNSFFFTIPTFLMICKKIETRELLWMNENAKKKALAEPNANPERLLFRQSGTITESGVVARTFFFSPATKSKSANIMMNIEKGVGVKQESGLISMNYKAGGVTRLMVGLTYEDLLEIALISQMRLQAYITARQIRGDFDVKYQNPNGTQERSGNYLNTGAGLQNYQNAGNGYQNTGNRNTQNNILNVQNGATAETPNFRNTGSTNTPKTGAHTAPVYDLRDYQPPVQEYGQTQKRVYDDIVNIGIPL